MDWDVVRSRIGKIRFTVRTGDGAPFEVYATETEAMALANGLGEKSCGEFVTGRDLGDETHETQASQAPPCGHLDDALSRASATILELRRQLLEANHKLALAGSAGELIYCGLGGAC